MQHAAEFKVLGAAGAAVGVGLVGASHGLVVVVTTGVEGEFPIAVGYAVVQCPVVGAAMLVAINIALFVRGADFIVAGEVAAVAEVEQVVDAEWAVY